MKAAEQESWKETPSPNAQALAASLCSALNSRHLRPNVKAPTALMPLTAEERYRMIDIVVQRQATRHHLTPESILWDWLDAEAEVKSH